MEWAMNKSELARNPHLSRRVMMEEDIEEDGVELVPLNLNPAPAPSAKCLQIEPLVFIHAHTFLDYVP
jgi:hypothetical protein